MYIFLWDDANVTVKTKLASMHVLTLPCLMLMGPMKAINAISALMVCVGSFGHVH